MDLRTPHDQLLHRIRGFSRHAWDSQQVAQRMKKLMPERLRHLKHNHRSGRRAGQAERQALNDQDYLQFLGDYVDVYRNALEARVQYETHMMLIEARKTLRVFRKHGFTAI